MQQQRQTIATDTNELSAFHKKLRQQCVDNLEKVLTESRNAGILSNSQ